MDPELRTAFDELRHQIETNSTETRRHAEGLVLETRQHAEGLALESRRHFDVTAEGLRGDIQLVAESVTMLSERVDRLELSLHEDMLRLQGELSAMIRFSYAELDRRMQTLEQQVTNLGARSADLEGRLQRLEARR